MAAIMSISALSSAVAMPKARSSFVGSQVPSAAVIAKPARAAAFVVKAADDDVPQGSRMGLGYQEKDSAGQSNIFSVEPPVYVAGSSRDDGQGKGSVAFAGIGGLAAIGLVVAGISFAPGDNNSVPVLADEGNFETLSFYKAKFSAPAPVVSAPEL